MQHLAQEAWAAGLLNGQAEMQGIAALRRATDSLNQERQSGEVGICCRRAEQATVALSKVFFVLYKTVKILR